MLREHGRGRRIWYFQMVPHGLWDYRPQDDISSEHTHMNPIQVIYRHCHLNVASVEEQLRFWTDLLGATAGTYGYADSGVRLTGGLILLDELRPTGGSKGTTLDHVGLQVPDLELALENVRAAGYRVVTAAEIPPALSAQVTRGIIKLPSFMAAFVIGPDDLKVELIADAVGNGTPAIHHVHLFTSDAQATQGWYVDTFGAAPGRRGAFETADLPGINLTFSTTEAPVVPTDGRVMDHIGFGVASLDAACACLDRAGMTLEHRRRKERFATAFLRDPWGTGIELTEELRARS